MITPGVEATDEEAPKESDGGDSDSHDESAFHINFSLDRVLGHADAPDTATDFRRVAEYLPAKSSVLTFWPHFRGVGALAQRQPIARSSA